MNSNFDYAFEVSIVRWEGGYVNDPDDPGGATKWGICARAYPNLDIKNLTIDQAKEIYYKDYWLKAKCDKLPSGIDIFHFDSCVNIGIRRASAFLQRAVRDCGKLIKVDGVIGPKTLSAIFDCNACEVLSFYAQHRAKYYIALAYNRGMKKFLKGWIRRVVDVVTKAGSMVRS